MNDLKTILQQKWNKPEVQKDWFMLPQDFAFNLEKLMEANCLDPLNHGARKIRKTFT